MSELVLDIETQKLFNETVRDKIHQLKVSVVGLYDYGRDLFQSFEESDLKALELILSNTTRLIGFNIRRFDLPVLQPYLFLSVDRLPVLDILDEVMKVLGHRVSLQSIAQATLGRGKSGSGVDAVRLYQEGKIEALKAYCLDDVRLTKEIYEYGQKHGKVLFFSERASKTFEVPVGWAPSPGGVTPTTFPKSLF